MSKLMLFFSLVIGINLNAQEKPEGLFINSKGPDVLLFYRGYWCPYSSKELQKLEDSLSFIKEKGAQIIAVTPEKQEGISKTIEKTKASYSIITDQEMKIMKAYDVAYKVDAKTVSRYKMANIDLAANNGQKPEAIYL